MGLGRLIQRLFFELRYRLNAAPWDTGIVPPELRAVIEGPQALPPGWMLDLGAGTGLNLVYAAHHGWRGVGVDFVGHIVAQASQRAEREGVADRVRFLQGDVTRLGTLPLDGPFDLLFDLGCFHGLSADGRTAYLRGAAALARPGSTYLLYAFRPRQIMGRSVGMEPETLRAIASPLFEITEAVPGSNPAYWYTLRRTAAPAPPIL